MKVKKKALTIALCVALLAVGTLVGTMAYFTDSDSAVNTFTVGKVKIMLDEADVKLDGTYETDVTNRVTQNKYHLIPGQTYIKDPTIHVEAGSSNCYVYVTIENEITEIEGAETVANQMAANGWSLLDGAADMVYVYKGSEGAPANVVKASVSQTDIPVFERFTIDGDKADNADLKASKDDFITVTGYAVQVEGFSSALEAWNTTYGA